MLNATDVFKIGYFAGEYMRFQGLIEDGNEDIFDEEGSINIYTAVIVSGNNGWRSSYCFLEVFEETDGMQDTDEGIFEEADRVMGIIGEQLNTAVRDFLATKGVEMAGTFYIGYSEDYGDIAVFYTQEVPSAYY